MSAKEWALPGPATRRPIPRFPALTSPGAYLTVRGRRGAAFPQLSMMARSILSASALSIAIFTATTMSLKAAAPLELKDFRAKSSYAIGTQIGRSFKQQGVELDTKVVVAAIDDVLAGRKSPLTEAEVKDVFAELQQVLAKKAESAGTENLKKGEDYLAANGKKEGVKTTASGLQYKVLKSGTGKAPKKEDTVKVHYTGTLIDGTKFDSSVDRGEPIEFPVSGVIPGWTEALLLMKEGDKWQLAIPAKIAYGENGQGPIPANSTLLFDVELLSVK